ncbi:TVP38/TMEM64 family protein [Oscillospiraceae bacterium]|nr:TVP38/TMEM64 family protein [Oscillospiraceae bacterium]BDF75071.1 TVP38/TMEM64 family protein [Oscillospiraceae bacterium]
MKRHQWAATLILTILLLGGGALLLWQTGFFAAATSLEGMRGYIEYFSPYSHAVYFLIQLLSVIIAPIPSNITALAGAVLFGTWTSFLLTAAAVIGGSMLVFWLARVLGRSFADKFVSQRVSDKYLEVIKRKRDIFLILVFLFPFFPDDLICILAGLTDVGYLRFFLIVTLTRPWGLLVACALGGSAISIPLWGMAAIGAVGLALFLVCLRYGDRWEQALLNRFQK